MRPRANVGIGAIALLVIGLAATLPRQASGDPAKANRLPAIHDVAHERTIVFGGYDTAPRGDGWALSLAESLRWDPLVPAGVAPAARFGHSAVYDPPHDQMVVFGGWTTAALSETWTMALSGPPAWTELQFAPGGTPSPRPYHSAVYDSRRRQMLVFGGQGIPNNFNDVWSLSLGDTARWGLVDPGCASCGTRPTRRLGHSAIYDAIRDRMIVFGGFPTSNDVWQLSLPDTHWTVITATGTPPRARHGHGAIYDPIGDRMIVFGGQDGQGQRLDDVWALSLSTPAWTPLAPSGTPPPGRAYLAAAYDSSRHAMVVFGGTHDGEENTWVLSLAPTPTWSPARPALSVSASDLQLETVTLGDTVHAPFSIANGGLVPLYLTAIDLPSDEWSLAPPPPTRLLWQEAAAGELVFVPRVARAPAQDTLVITTNDPVDPNKRVTLGVEVLGLDFESKVLGSPTEVPLGVTFIVVATPDTGVRIEQGTLFYRSVGAASFDSLALTPLATDFIAAVPAGAVTESGVEYYVRVQNSGFTATQPPRTQAVTPPDTMTAVPRATPGSGFLVGRDIEVEVLLPDGATFVSGQIHFREGGAESYETDALAIGGALGRPVGLIPARVVGPRGVEYWVETHTLTSDLRYPETPAEPAIVSTKVQNLVEPADRPGGRYRLLSVPLDFGQDFSGSLDAILTDQLGTYDPVQWRAYRYDPDSLQNFEFSPSKALAFQPRPGRAFWLISRNTHRANTSPIDGFSPPTVQPYPIEILRGWNLFGNPFDFPVNWSDVVRDSAVVGSPVAFDASRGTVGDYADGTPSVLAPFEGYFVENTGTEPETLWVQPRSASGAAPGRIAGAVTPAAAPGAAGGAWRLRLTARTEAAIDGANDFGVDPGAADGFDPLDLRKPPLPPGPWVHAAFAHNDWNAMPGMYRRDLRGSEPEGHVWEVELRSGTAGELVTLDLSASISPAPDLVVRILDREQGSLSDRLPAPRGGSETNAADLYRIVSFGPERPYRLAVIAGSEAYVTRAAHELSSVPARSSLDPNAPNPFRTATRIRFGLPHASQVSVEIYSVLGERVAIPMNQEWLEPGYHALAWDGRRSNGAPAPSGIYLLRLVAGAETLSRRIVLVR